MCTQSIKPTRWQDKRMKAISRIVNKKNYLTEYYIEEYYGVSNSKHKTKQEYKREMYK
jgi:hypothetical protein